MKIQGVILFLLFCEFHGQPYPDELKTSEQLLDASQDSNQGRNTIKIGLILDSKSWVGKVINSSITMAISDFYMLNGQYKTRIALETRDSRGELLHSIAAGFDLLVNAETQAIIVQEMSNEEAFLATLCDKANVLLLSLSSTSSFDGHPYLLQVAQDETTQFNGVAAFLKAFQWRTVVLIYEDTADTRQILSHLHDTFRDNDVDAVNDVAITPRATDEEIIKKLHNFRTLRTSIIILHTSVSLASQIFKNAKTLEMMSGNFAWIVTSKIMNLLEFQDPAVFETIQGVVGLKSYIPASSKHLDFTLRWRREFQLSQIDTEVRGLNVFGIWAYDAIWALAEAIERARIYTFPNRGEGLGLNLTGLTPVRVSNVGSTLLSKFRSIQFTGLGGKFQLVNAKLVHETYEIVNMIGNVGKRVGFWTPACGLTKEIYPSTNSCSSSSLETIIWPGFSKTAPKGWLDGRPLKVGVPNNSRFDELISWQQDQKTNVTTVSGFCLDVFLMAIKRLDREIAYEFIPYYNDNGSYSDLINQVYLQTFDAAMGDITITSNRSQYVDFTLPYTEIGVGMVARLDNKDPWFFLKPLSVDLWITSAGFFIVTGIIVWFIEHPTNGEFQGSLARQIGTILWFAASTLVYAQRERLQSNLSRFVVGVWFFVVLILTSSYIANLSSLLTVQRIELTKNDYVGYSANSFVKGLVSNLNFEDNRLKPFNSAIEYDRALRNGSVRAILEEIPYLRIFMAKYRYDDYIMIDSSEKTNGFAFAFPKGSPLVHEMSRQIAMLREEEILQALENKWFTSQSSLSSTDTKLSTANTLEITNFSRLFLVNAICKVVALLLFFVFVLFDKMFTKYYFIRMLAGRNLLSIFRYLFPANTVGGITTR